MTPLAFLLSLTEEHARGPNHACRCSHVDACRHSGQRSCSKLLAFESQAVKGIDVDDDFDTVEGLAAQEVEYQRTAAAATAAGVPPRRSSRSSLVASTAAADAARRAERAPLPADPQVPPGV